MYEGLDLEKFCGSLSTEFWEGRNVGFCMAEISMHSPLSISLSIISLIYLLKMIPSLTFERPFTTAIILRIVLDFFILFKSISYLVSLILSFRSSSGFSFAFIVNSGSTLVCTLCVTFLDIFHGKANRLNSRGPFFLLLIEILYFYISSLQMWSLLSKPPISLNKSMIIGQIFDVLFFGLRLITKLPIIYAIEPDRLRRSRFLRHSKLNNQGQSPSIPNSRCTPPAKSETSANCLSKILFTWFTETITRGFYGELFSLKSLPVLPKALSAKSLEKILTIESRLFAAPSKFLAAIPLVRQLYSRFRNEILLLGSVKFLLSVISLVNPIFLNYFIAELVNFSNNWVPAVVWGSSLIISRLLNIFVGTVYDYWSPRLGYKIKASVVSLVFQQLLKCKSSFLVKFSTGNLVNLLATDAGRVFNLIPNFNELWAMPLQVVVAVWLLYYQVGISCLMGVGFLVLLLPINRFIVGLIGKFSSDLMYQKDIRVKFMSEVLQRMTAVKLSCWEVLIRRKILFARNLELKALRKQKLLDAVCVFLWAACPALLSGSTFAAYVALGNTLEPAKVFTSLALFNMLIGPMNAFPWILNGIAEAWISAGRICSLFEADTSNSQKTNQVFSDEEGQDLPQFQDDVEIILRSPAIYWESVDNAVLTDIDIVISKGELIGVVGPIASGKSSFLLALMGELHAVHPPFIRGHLRIAYVSFIPWLQNGTIRENILFGETLDSGWLNSVIDACGLSEDLAEIPEGLDKEVGEGGSRLSGGQKARIALARAVYQRADVYLFDDPLASLDSHVARIIIRKCIGRHGVLADKTRIIATHHFKWLFNENDSNLDGPADRVIKLSEGRIVEQWIPTVEIVRSSGEIYNWKTEATTLNNINDDLSTATFLDDAVDQTPLLTFSPAEDEDSDDFDSTNWEKFAFGSISYRVYWTYARALGCCLAAWVLISLALMQVSRNAQDYWLSYWMQHEKGNATPSAMKYIGSKSFPLIGALSHLGRSDLHLDASITNSTKFYLSVYGGIIGANLFFTIFRSILFAFAGLRAAATIHEKMLDAVFQGEMHFFDTTPLGRILNRFSSDVGTVDDGLPFIFNILLAIIFSLLGSVVVSALAMPAVVIICFPLLFAYWSVQRVYRAAARDLRRLSSVTRSPLYAHFTETIGGLVVIRGLHKEMAFQTRFRSRLNAQTRCDLAGLAASAWLNLRLQVIALLAVTGVVLVALVGSAFNLVDVNLAGLAVIYALMLANLLTSLVSVMSSTEVDFISVERCRELIEETPFEPDVATSSVVAPRPLHRALDPHVLFMSRVVSTCPEVEAVWPSQGRIVFKEVSLVYPSATASTERNADSLEWREGSASEEVENFALIDINLSVEAGEHIGVVGRTGSGKSSLLRVLFRLVRHMEGPVNDLPITRVKKFRGATGMVHVDGVDVRKVPLNVLRSRMLCVSQDPFLFSGTVRENLDPYNSHTENELVHVLVRCGLVNDANEAPRFLDIRVGEAGRSLSAGQRQLLCLARALFRPGQAECNIVCLDEATSSLDNISEKKIQDLLNNDFAKSTVILVAHRLSTVLNCCSRVVVLSFGRIVEEGSPQDLAQDPNSHFHKMLYSKAAHLSS